MINKKKVIYMFLVFIFLSCLSACKGSESEKYLQCLQKFGVKDNSQYHWQNSWSDKVQISPNGIFISENEDKYDKILYKIDNGEYKKIAEQVYDFFEFEGRVYFYNSENKIYCYNIETGNTNVLLSSSTDILWISLYKNSILCARRSGIYNNVLELYDLEGKRIKIYFEKRGEFGQIVRIGRFVVFLENIRAEVYDLEEARDRYLFNEDGLSDSFMVSDGGYLYVSVERYVIKGNYNTSKADSQWNGLWKISISDMEKDKWNLTKISDLSYSKFYCIKNKLFDEKFNLIE